MASPKLVSLEGLSGQPQGDATEAADGAPGPRAAGRTLGEVEAGPLPPPRHGAGLLPWRRCERLAAQATRAQGASLAPAGQAASRALALAAVGEARRASAGYPHGPPRS